MTDYFVRKTGSDVAAGTTPATAWLTIDKAANTVAAGDTVYIGGGVYVETVTMDTSGSAGNQITFYGDFLGTYTGDPGNVIITPWSGAASFVSITGATLVFNQHSHITWQHVIFIGGDGSSDFPVSLSGASDTCYEEVKFILCAFITANNQTAFYMDMNYGATPTGDGILIEQCVFLGAMTWDAINNVTAHVNGKINIRGCLFTQAAQAITLTIASTSNAFSVGGIYIVGNTFCVANYAIYLSTLKNTTHPSHIHNNYIKAGIWGIISYSASGAVIVGTNCPMGLPFSFSNVTEADYFGGLMLPAWACDFLMRRYYGFSPYKPWEIVNAELGITDTYYSASGTGSYMARATSTSLDNHTLPATIPLAPFITYINGSDDAVTDPDSAWGNEANIFDPSQTNTGTISSNAGSDVSKYIHCGGVQTIGEETSSILQVRLRLWAYSLSASPQVLVCRIYTDGLAETLGTLYYDCGDTGAVLTPSAWQTLTPPAAGWNWTNLAALECKLWREDGTGIIYVSSVQLEVTTGLAYPVGTYTHTNVGVQDAVTFHAGANSRALVGAGITEFLVPVNAELTTIQAWMRFDANYGGANKPQLKVLNIPGVADQTSTMTAAAATWQQVVCTFTPTSAGIVRVQIVSRDTEDGRTNYDEVKPI